MTKGPNIFKMPTHDILSSCTGPFLGRNNVLGHFLSDVRHLHSTPFYLLCAQLDYELAVMDYVLTQEAVEDVVLLE